ncbi:MAG: hypothetical protein Edafosvirus14_23 [Edafosvirus sp.]|uniref:Leucine-rich repeat protein n=1 Tax=Edafosvirus sp. TaxID=2487765 RepID=A0A3G4ZU89_9VIRU|nr:MAG: hypothetical protein Edafosvirus14_23 [Edafosvirus sp.]
MDNCTDMFDDCNDSSFSQFRNIMIKRNIEQIIKKNMENQEEELDITKCQMKILPKIFKEFTWVKVFVARENGLENLENLPPNIIALNCSRNRIVTIQENQLPQSLIQIDISNNRLIGLDNLPDGIETLSCTDNYIEEHNIKQLPKGLKKLDISNNKLSSVPKFNEGLMRLDISSNIVHKIDNLPDSITELDCSSCDIKVVCKFPPKIEKFISFYNHMIYIKEFPESLVYLDISNNNLSKIPPLPPKITFLDISKNDLHIFPDEIPETLVNLDISRNKITEIPRSIKEREHTFDSLKYDRESNNHFGWRGGESTINDYHGRNHIGPHFMTSPMHQSRPSFSRTSLSNPYFINLKKKITV